jgi:hypothetical protein
MERDLKRKGALPQTSWWKQGTNAQLGRLVREHQEHFPESKLLRSMCGAGYILFLLAFTVALFQSFL